MKKGKQSNSRRTFNRELKFISCLGGNFSFLEKMIRIRFFSLQWHLLFKSCGRRKHFSLKNRGKAHIFSLISIKDSTKQLF